MSSGDLRTLLSEPARIRTLTQRIRAKVPSRDVDDVVQSTLADALATDCPPADESALDRWLIGIARHKVADYYRSHRRHELVDGDIDGHNSANETQPESARDLLRWAHGEIAADAEAPRTLEWMMREADGDRLESIAEENNISAPAVRQRVSRLRRYLRERWTLQLAAALTLLAVVVGSYAYMHRGPTVEPEPPIRAESPAQIAKAIRDTALEECRNGHWQVCLEQLERAKRLDPVGDGAATIVAARAEAERALQPTPSPSPSDSEQRLVPAGQEQKTLAPNPQQAPKPLHSYSPKSKSDAEQSTHSQSLSKSGPNLNSSNSNSGKKKTSGNWSLDFDKK